MTIALKAIEDGKKTRDELNAALKRYYSQYHKGSEWSDTVVNTMRSGLFSRLNELGLVRREKLGKNIRYHITEEGKKYLQNLPGKEEIKEEFVQEGEKRGVFMIISRKTKKLSIVQWRWSDRQNGRSGAL